MGVDRPRGRAQGGRRLLTSPPREEPVDLPSAHSAQELARRLDARMDGAWSEMYGAGISVRREPGRYRLTPRSATRQAVRPQALVRVVPDGDGARLAGVIRSTAPNAVLSVAAVSLMVVVLALWAAMGGAGMAVFGMVIVVAASAGERVRVQGQWDQLRKFLDELVAP